MKKIYYILFLILLNQCGYTSIYNNNSDKTISINILKIEGDNGMNSLIKSQLVSYLNLDKENSFNIEIKTSYSKSIISKDKKGVATEYKLEANTRFIILYNEKKYELFVNENKNTKNSNDSFELKKYENIIKFNFAQSTKEKLISKLYTLK